MKIVEKEYNVLTGETTFTERDETAQEQAEREALEAKLAKEQAETAAKEAARQALLDKLGITAEEAQLLLGGK
jgi:predicted RNA-binding protein with PIN domain